MLHRHVWVGKKLFFFLTWMPEQRRTRLVTQYIPPTQQHYIWKTRYITNSCYLFLVSKLVFWLFHLMMMCRVFGGVESMLGLRWPTVSDADQPLFSTGSHPVFAGRWVKVTCVLQSVLKNKRHLIRMFGWMLAKCRKQWLKIKLTLMQPVVKSSASRR